MNIPMFKIHCTDADTTSVHNVLVRGSSWAIGKEVAAFEQGLASYVGSKYAVTFNSGTSALFAGLLALGVTEGEVIVPSFTFISTANAVSLTGAKPVFADIESETLGLDASDVAKRITSATKAVMLVHYAGVPARDTLALKKLCDEKGILFLEDSAGALGSTIGETKAGSIGHWGMFSFCQNKVLTTGEGGVLVTNDKETYDKLLRVRSHGRDDSNNTYFTQLHESDYIDLGHNFRMSSMQAALGLSQLNRIDAILSMRNAVVETYAKRLAGIDGLSYVSALSDTTSGYQLFTLVLDDYTKRDALQQHLEKDGVSSKPYFHPIHQKPLYTSDDIDLPVTDNVAGRVLSLPMYPHMSIEEINYVCSSIIAFFRGDSL